VVDYLLDTNIVSYWYDVSRSEHSMILKRINTIKEPSAVTGYVPRLYVSVVTLGEIEYGHRVAPAPDTSKQAEYKRFVREQFPEVLEMTDDAAESYGELRAWLFDNCGPKAKRSKVRRAEELVHPTTGRELGIDENDIWIAAQAKTHNLVLVTHDSRGNLDKVLQHFAPSLMIEDWAS
jgi:tRNA(fMet)-specific endonuclease VapC